MNYIFFGTPKFSAIILEKLITAGFIPTAVVTNPDRPVGRKKVLTATAVKTRIRNIIEILQPEKLDDGFIQKLKSLNPEFGVLAAYGKIIPKEVIDIFPKGIIVVHPSLLPKYRGATPIQSVILAGKKKTGTTLFLMDEKVDHGNLISDFRFQILNNDNYETLSKKLADASAELLIKTLPKYLAGEIKPQTQNHSQATYTKKFNTENGYIDPEELKKAVSGENPETANQIWLKVRALNPEPGVYTIIKREQPPFAKAKEGQRRMKLLATDLVDGKLILKKVQFEGKKPTSYIPNSRE